MEVRSAIAGRRSVRGFRSEPVDHSLLVRLITEAARAPSGGNLQPWHVDLVTGTALARLRSQMQSRLAAGTIEPPEYDIYPRELTAPYRDRRFAIGEAMYARIGIPREDKAARRKWFTRNFAFFGAPAALFVTIDRAMGPPQWSDLGMFLQSFMLLALDAGLATCAQECWALYPETVKTFLAIPDTRILFCGMAIGPEDRTEPVNALHTGRALSDEWLLIHDD